MKKSTLGKILGITTGSVLAVSVAKGAPTLDVRIEAGKEGQGVDSAYSIVTDDGSGISNGFGAEDVRAPWVPFPPDYVGIIGILDNEKVIKDVRRNILPGQTQWYDFDVSFPAGLQDDVRIRYDPQLLPDGLVGTLFFYGGDKNGPAHVIPLGSTPYDLILPQSLVSEIGRTAYFSYRAENPGETPGPNPIPAPGALPLVIVGGLCAGAVKRKYSK